MRRSFGKSVVRRHGGGFGVVGEDSGVGESLWLGTDLDSSLGVVDFAL